MTVRRSGVRNSEAVAYVTANYPHLQGLRIVPLGLPFLLAAVWRGVRTSTPAATDATVGRWFLLVFLLALAGSVAAGRYYRTRYGVVRLHLRDQASPLLLSVVLGFATLVWQQLDTQWPVPPPVVFVGIVLVWLGGARGGLRKHYAVIGGACLAFSMLGVFGVAAETRRLLLDVLMGSGLIGGGVGDPRVRRGMPRPPQPEACGCAL